MCPPLPPPRWPASGSPTSSPSGSWSASSPGTRIKQDELADELDASRIPVREALRILDSRGLVTVRANTGAWVSEMSLHDLGLSYQIRERIEPLLLAESLPHLSDHDVDRMREIQAAIESNEDIERFLVLDREFHWASYCGARASQLTLMVERLWDTTQHYRRAFSRMTGAERAWVVNSEHRLLIEAAAAKNLENASTVLSMHIRRTRVELARHPELLV